MLLMNCLWAPEAQISTEIDGLVETLGFPIEKMSGLSLQIPAAFQELCSTSLKVLFGQAAQKQP